MDPQLKQAFYTCYRNYGKISTKKLLASLVDPKAILVSDEMVSLTGYNGIPSRQDVQVHEATAEDDIGWLESLRRGPGVSPCVMNTCSRVLKATDQQKEIDTLYFLEVLSGTAVELSRLVRQHGVDVPRMVSKARA